MKDIKDIEYKEKNKYAEFIKSFEVNVNWAKEHYDKISNLMKHKSVCDIGCGDGGFCVDCIDKFGATEVYGLDIITVEAKLVREHARIKYINAYSHSIPLADKTVDYVTAFDVLEHIHESVIEQTIREFARISRIGGIFTISHVLSGQNVNGENSHICVHNVEWWNALLAKHFTGNVNIVVDESRQASFWNIQHS